MSISNSISLLINDIVASKEFLELKEAKAIVMSFPEYKSRVMKFEEVRRKIFDDDLSQAALQIVIADMDEEYMEMQKIPEIKNYFFAADNVNALIGSVIDEINIRLDKF